MAAEPNKGAACAKPARLLQMQGVGKTFSGRVEALRGMDLTVNVGEFVSLLGPSGCGKSTALRLIAGLSEPTRGRISWQGEHGHGSIGIVFQEPTLMPWATVGANVWLPFRLKGESFKSAQSKIMESLELVGLEQFYDSYPRELSGGMKMRVSIARALVTNPRVILMDEPFAALDEITRFRLNHDLLRMKEAIGCTIVFVTHSVFESVFLSERIVVMAARPGRVIKEIPIDKPYPRDDRFRTSTDYAAYCRVTSHALQLAIDEAE